MAAKLLVATDDMFLAAMRRMVNQGLITVEQYNESFTRALERRDEVKELK